MLLSLLKSQEDQNSPTRETRQWCYPRCYVYFPQCLPTEQGLNGGMLLSLLLLMCSRGRRKTRISPALPIAAAEACKKVADRIDLLHRVCGVGNKPQVHSFSD